MKQSFSLEQLAIETEYILRFHLLFSVCGDADGDSEKDYGRFHSRVKAAIVMVKGYSQKTYLPL